MTTITQGDNLHSVTMEDVNGMDISVSELSGINRGLRESANREFATDAEVQAVLTKHGLV